MDGSLLAAHKALGTYGTFSSVAFANQLWGKLADEPAPAGKGNSPRSLIEEDTDRETRVSTVVFLAQLAEEANAIKTPWVSRTALDCSF